MLHLDFETTSLCELKTAGLHRYAEDPTTRILLISYAFDEEEVQYVFGGVPPEKVADHIAAGGLVVGQNVAFEIAIINGPGQKTGWPTIKPEQTRCTMVQSYSMNMPGSLEMGAAAYGIDQQKDMVGNKIMLKLSKASYSPTFDELCDLAIYGTQDVVVERMLEKRQVALSPSEQALWVLDQKINNRGICVDLPAVEKAIALVELEKKRLNAEMVRVTDNAVATCTALGQLKDYLTWNKVDVGDSLAKDDVSELLKDPALPSKIREVLLLRQQGSKSSTAKLKTMLSSVNFDGRIRGTLQFHGAGQTGRWAGRKLQTHNLPKGRYEVDDVEHIFTLLHTDPTGDVLRLSFGSVLQVISDCLRSFIIAPPGSRLFWGDFNAIEARVLAWLAGEEHVLETFRQGKDIYKAAYAAAFRIRYEDVTKDQRQVGKVMILALGYQGGVGAMQQMSKGIVKLTDKESNDLKARWREAHPNIVSYWHTVERQALKAILNPGQTYSAGPTDRQVSYKVKGSFLWCRLPSGRLICYPYPKVKQKETPWGEMKDAITYMGEDSDTRRWERQDAYGGLLVENITQAVARDLLAAALSRLDNEGFPIVLHVHDEVVCEIPEGSFGGNAAEIKARIESVMGEVPSWANGLPVKVSVEDGMRYAK